MKRAIGCMSGKISTVFGGNWSPRNMQSGRYPTGVGDCAVEAVEVRGKQPLSSVPDTSLSCVLKGVLRSQRIIFRGTSHGNEEMRTVSSQVDIYMSDTFMTHTVIYHNFGTTEFCSSSRSSRNLVSPYCMSKTSRVKNVIDPSSGTEEVEDGRDMIFASAIKARLIGDWLRSIISLRGAHMANPG